MNGLLTDLYELTMAAGYFAAGKTGDIATFELSVRRLPKDRTFLIVAGVEQALDYLEKLSFEPAEIEYLRGLPQFGRAPAGFFEHLRNLRFCGDVFAVPEGSPLFAGEPILTVRAPIIEAQIVETYLLAAVTFQSLIATKALRVVEAARGRGVVEFGTRRAHTAEAGVLGARAAFIGGCAGTSNTLAGFRFGIPVYGTSAHSWVMAFPSELESFRRLQELLGPYTTQLVDTYDTLEGTRRAASLGRPIWGVRIDSGDFNVLSREVRKILDAAGLNDVRIMASGDLNEFRVAELVGQDAPIDSFGVGTELATSADAPSMGSVYKLVELESGGQKRYTCKRSDFKPTLPGAKQIFRFPERDVLARTSEALPGGEPLLEPVILKGQRQARGGLGAARNRALAWLPRASHGSLPVEWSTRLRALVEETRRLDH